ncbi:hypothetical protein L6Q21_13500 [Sandaracinobacter sp. RS1-74]|uniref:hypothetical protein n=1 Tax=Sandaracinobacteroides sayramensis TaxID=2913411 RepID=UPI001EDAD6A5|nr:hypothetical protein [Sandaracinobacteroides sayramensis]MCG2841998.1 hypothetical protein [Sandaracinobacteroides sayramensis]
MSGEIERKAFMLQRTPEKRINRSPYSSRMPGRTQHTPAHYEYRGRRMVSTTNGSLIHTPPFGFPAVSFSPKQSHWTVGTCDGMRHLLRANIEVNSTPCHGNRVPVGVTSGGSLLPLFAESGKSGSDGSPGISLSIP